MRIFEKFEELVSTFNFLCLLNLIFVLLLAPGNCEALDQQYVRVIVANVPPFDAVKIYPNGSFEAVGCSKNIAEWLAVKLNFSLVYVYPTEDEMKRGGIEAFVDMIASGKADVLTTGTIISPARFVKIDLCTYPQWDEGNKMAVPRPGEQDRLFAFIKPFDGNVWIMTGVSFVVVSLFMGLLTWASALYANNNSGKAKKINKKASDYLGKYFLYNINVLTTHGDYLSESNNVSFLVGVGCWLLGASILVYGYSSLVVSSITLSNQLPSVNSFEDVLAHPEISLIIRTDTYIGNLINTSTDNALYKALREKALKRPESVGNEGIINSTKLLLTGKYAYPFIETIVKFVVANQFMRDGVCRLKISKHLSLPISQLYSSVQRGNKQLNRRISVGIMKLAETGLIRQWMKAQTWIPQADVCFAEVLKETATQQSIKLIDLASAFFILGVGAALSILAFVIELLVSYK